MTIDCIMTSISCNVSELSDLQALLSFHICFMELTLFELEKKNRGSLSGTTFCVLACFYNCTIILRRKKTEFV